MSLTALRGKTWARLGSELYCFAGWQVDPWQVLEAWMELLPPSAIFAGDTAAWMHGMDLQPLTPVEVMLPSRSGMRSRQGLMVRRCTVEAVDVIRIRSLPATSLHRTLVDGCAHKSDGEALVALDMALRLRRTNVAELSRYAESIKTAGAIRMRRLVTHAEAAESAMETRLRWLLVSDGLPRPHVQVDLHDQRGHLIARADLYYAAQRLVIEFDGGNHKERLVADNRRQNLLINAGFTLLRFTTADLRDRPDVILEQVRAALRRPKTHV